MDDSKTSVSCNRETVKDIKDRVTKIKTFLEQYKWIADAYVSDFFVHDFWSRLPPRWTDYLRTLSPPEISFLLKHDGQTYRTVPPLSLLSFRMCVVSLALGRCPADLDNEEVVKNILSSLTSKRGVQSESILQKDDPDKRCVAKELNELDNETVVKHSPKHQCDQHVQCGNDSDEQCPVYNRWDMEEQTNGQTDNTKERDRNIVSKDNPESQKYPEINQSNKDLIQENCKGRELINTSSTTQTPSTDQTLSEKNSQQKCPQSNSVIEANGRMNTLPKSAIIKTYTSCDSVLQQDSRMNSTPYESCMSEIKTGKDCETTPHHDEGARSMNVPRTTSAPKESCTSGIKTVTDCESPLQHDEEARRMKMGGSRLADRGEWRGVMKNGQWMELEHIYRKHIKPKKQHEIQKLSQAISYLCCLSGSDQVVDVGAGLGHLSRLLTFGHGVKVTTVEASGGHAPKASKYDRETKKDIKKAKMKKQKLTGKDSNDKEDVSLPVNLPSHISCMIHPNISTPHFLELIRRSRSQQQMDTEEQTVSDSHLECGNRIDKNCENMNSVVSNTRKHQILKDSGEPTHSEEQTINGGHLECGNEMVENDEINSVATNSMNVISKDQIQATERVSQKLNRSIENCENSLSRCNGIDSEQKNILKDKDDLNHLEKRMKMDECDKSRMNNETTDLSIETKPELDNSEPVSKIDDAHNQSLNQREHLSRTTRTSIDDKDQIQNLSESTGKSKCERTFEKDSTIVSTDPMHEETRPQEREEFILAGLHACGDLTPTLIRMFVNCEAAIGLASVGCCYMKLSLEGKIVESAERGYPMSQFVCGLPDPDLSYSSRELACHFADAYIQRLQDNPPHLKIHSYRAALQHVIISLIPGFQHGVTKLTIKNAVEKPFAMYAQIAMEKLGYKSEIPSELLTEAESYLPFWKDIVIFYTIRLSLAPVIETLVMLDRMLYLYEQGIPSSLVPIFDPKLSPRNFVLLALKPEDRV